MKIELSPSEVGLIVNSLQERSQGSDESTIAEMLTDEVYQYFSGVSRSDMFDKWVEEFDIVI